MAPAAVRGHLDMLLLAILRDGPSHGYAVIEALRVRSGEVFDLPEGTVYPALHRLERAGLLTSDWDEGPGRRRRRYRLTDQGLRALGEQRRAWADLADAISSVLEGDPWPSPTPT